MFSREAQEWRDQHGQQLLFCHASLSDVLTAREKEALERAETISIGTNEERAEKAISREIIKSFALEIPRVHWDNALWSESEAEIPSDPLTREVDKFFGGPSTVMGDCAELLVNTTGDTSVFLLYGSTFHSRPPRAQVNPSSIAMTVCSPRGTLTHEWVQSQFVVWKTEIEAGLLRLTNDYAGWEEHIEEKVHQIIRKRSGAREQRSQIINALNQDNGDKGIDDPVRRTQDRNRRLPERPAWPMRNMNTASSSEKRSKEERKMEIFLCFAGAERVDVAQQLRTALKNLGLDVWLDEDKILPGQRWAQRLRKGVVDSAYMVLIVSESWFTSAWAQRETYMGVRLGRDQEERMIPLLVGIAPDDPQFQQHWLGEIQAIVWRDNPDEVSKKIQEVITAQMNG